MINKKLIVQILSYVLVAAVSVAVTLGVFLVLDEANVGTGKLQALEELIQEKFIGDADLTEMEDAAAEAMIGAIGDRWSYYIPADEFAAYKEQKANAYVGIGITITQPADASGLNVTQVTAGGSAEQAGIMPGDFVIAVDGESIVGMKIDDIRNMIRGEAGTNVSITVQRQGEEKTFSVTRRQIKTPVAVGKLLEGNIGLITIENFNSGCREETIAAIEELRSQGAQKLIFDVRFNPGGYARELVALLDYLLPKGDLFKTVDYRGVTDVSRSDEKCLEMPMAVLANGDSYSAAEFFAAALREYDWATVVGEQTCGKGHFQSTFQLPDGSAVALSIGKYYTPKGISLDGVGITPDVPVKVDQKTAAAIYAGTLDPMEDPQILAAIEALNSEN